jgi:hypothetical protein
MFSIATSSTGEKTAMITSILPLWVGKLPFHVWLFIFGLVMLHAIVIIGAIWCSFRSSKPDFKSKLG